MAKYLLLFFFLLNSFLSACSLCTTSGPQVDVYTTITANKDKTNFDITWQFHKEYVETLKIYDINSNGIFDKAEINLILKVIVKYIKPIHYLTNIEYLPKEKAFEEYYIEPIITNFEKISINENGMRLHYNFDMDFILQAKKKLSISFFDGGENYNLNLKNLLLKGYDNFHVIVPKLNETYIFFYKEYKSELKKLQPENIPDILKYGNNTNKN